MLKHAEIFKRCEKESFVPSERRLNKRNEEPLLIDVGSASESAFDCTAETGSSFQMKYNTIAYYL